MKIIKASMIFLLLLILNVSALELFDKECKDDGSLKLVLKGDSPAKVYTQDITVKVGQAPVNGSWDSPYMTRATISKMEYSTFQTEENTLRSSGLYTINIDYIETNDTGNKAYESMSFNVDCPGIQFTCKALEMKIESCENNNDGLFRAVVDANGLEQPGTANINLLQAVDFYLEAESQYKDMTGNEVVRGSLPLNTQVLRIQKDKYVLRYEFSKKNRVKTLRAEFNTRNMNHYCEKDKYQDVKFYDKITCTDTQVSEVTPQEEIKVQTQAVKEPPREEKPAENKKTAEQILQEQQKDYKPLAVISIIMIVVLSIGGIIISHLYKRGYI